MHTEKREGPNLELGYEPRDINIKAIVRATVVFFIFFAVSGALGGLMYWLMNPALKHGPAEKMDRQEVASNVPLVQSNMEAKTDIAAIRLEEEERLYGAAKQQKDGTYSIPIAAAMYMIANPGKKPEAPATTTETAPTAIDELQSTFEGGQESKKPIGGMPAGGGGAPPMPTEGGTP